MDPAKAHTDSAHIRGRAEAGDTSAMVEMANRLFGMAAIAADQGRADESAELATGAKAWLATAAKGGNADAMVGVGLVLVHAEGERRSGIEWLTKASRLGHDAAFQNLCNLLSPLELLQWVEQERPQGNPAAIKFFDELKNGLPGEP